MRSAGVVRAVVLPDAGQQVVEVGAVNFQSKGLAAAL